MKTVVIVPTYNEKENIRKLVIEILRNEVEVVVVDDNSPDSTWKIVEEMGKEDKRVHLLLRTKNKGRGLAGVDGFKWSLEKGYDVMIEMDADFSHDPKYIPGFLSAIKECDVVLGSRFVNGGREVGRPLLRRMITRFANAYIRWILGLKVRDCNSGYRCYKRGVLENVGLDKFVSKGPSIVQEMIYRVHLKGFKIGEIPITFVEREEGSSKLGPQQLWRGYMMVLKLRFMKISGKI